MYMKLKINQKTGFTLAEVLITLSVIGIVASLTLPGLIQNNRNKELKTGLNRGYSLINQALDMYYAEHGERAKNGDNINNTFKPYLKIIKDCGYAYASGEELADGCIPNDDDARENGTVYKTYNGKNFINLNYFDDAQFILNDGMTILIESPGTTVLNRYISVDVNGYRKRPNRLGQDLFMFQLADNGKLLPMGSPNTDYYSADDSYCSLTSTNKMNGAGCTYKALTEKNYFNNLPK